MQNNVCYIMDFGIIGACVNIMLITVLYVELLYV